MRSSAVINILDQGVSSLSNLAASLLIAKYTSPERFNQFGLMFAVFITLLGLSRAYFGESILSLSVRSRPRNLAAASGSLALTSVPVGMLLAAVSACFPSTRAFGILLGVFLPGLLFQDFVRYVAFSMQRPKVALGIDALWLLLFLVAAGVSLAFGSPTGTTLFGMWALIGTLSGLAGGLIVRLRPSFAAAWANWIKPHFRLGLGFALEFSCGGGAGQVVVFALGGIVGSKALGDIRGGQILTGPLNVLFVGCLVTMTQVSAHRKAKGLSPRRTLASGGCLLALVAGLWAGAIAITPAALGHHILGPNWERSQRTGTLLALSMAGTGLAMGAAAGLRAGGHSQDAFKARLFSLPVVLVFAIGGGLVGGVTGACYGFGIGNLAVALAYWWLLEAATRAAVIRDGTALSRQHVVGLNRLGWARRVLTIQKNTQRLDVSVEAAPDSLDVWPVTDASGRV